MVCCCRSTVASGAISQDDLNSQQNYCFSADSCSPFFLGGERSILLSYRDIYSKNPYFSRLFGLPGKEPGSSGTLFGLADPSIFASDFEGDFANEHGIMSSVLAKPVKSER